MANGQPKNALNIIAGLFGNTLEWYDFMLFASFSPLFAKLFFPSHDYFLSLVSTFGVFALGFLIRPLGGIVLGHYGDRLGRRITLIMSVTLMTVGSLLIACLPTYEHIGIAAPLLFTLLRLLQGFAIGGELPNSATFLIETLFKNRAFGGSLTGSTAYFGIVIGTGVATLITHLTSTEALVWSWRIAYFVGGLLGFIGIYLRLRCSESTQFLENTDKSVSVPFKEILQHYKLPLLGGILFTSILAAGNYILIAYSIIFLTKTSGFSLADTLTINFSALVVITLLIPAFGWIADQIGVKRIFMMGLICLLVFILPAFMLLKQHTFTHALLGEILLAIILAPINSTIAALITSMFPITIRASGNSIAYNVGQAIFGGTAPLVALTLVEYTGNVLAPAWYLLAITAAVLIYMTVVKVRQINTPPY